MHVSGHPDRHPSPLSPGGRRRLAALVMAVSLLMTSCARSGPVSSPSSASAPGPTPVSDALGTNSPSAPSAASATPAVASCRQEAAALPVATQVGQLFMVSVAPGTSPQRVANLGVGSVILLGDWDNGQAATRAEVEAMTRAVPTLLVATDQEGGLVQKVKGSGIDTIPNAVAQAAMGDEALTAAATKWGVQLWGAGVRYNLAPVADVVPAAKIATNQPIGQLKRGYGSDPAVAGARVSAFVAGMKGSSIATSLKHFPGLGEVIGNTDFTTATDAVTTRTSPTLEPFRAGIQAGASSVMVSSAIYTQIDPGVPAVFSTVILTEMLRGDLGFTGVVISDDLGAAKSVAHVPASERAVRFVAAGGDLLINADPSLQPAMTEAVVKRVAADPAFAAKVTAAAGRVLALKSSVGIGTCQG